MAGVVERQLKSDGREAWGGEVGGVCVCARVCVCVCVCLEALDGEHCLGRLAELEAELDKLVCVCVYVCVSVRLVVDEGV